MMEYVYLAARWIILCWTVYLFFRAIYCMVSMADSLKKIANTQALMAQPQLAAAYREQLEQKRQMAIRNLEGKTNDTDASPGPDQSPETN